MSQRVGWLIQTDPNKRRSPQLCPLMSPDSKTHPILPVSIFVDVLPMLAPSPIVFSAPSFSSSPRMEHAEPDAWLPHSAVGSRPQAHLPVSTRAIAGIPCCVVGSTSPWALDGLYPRHVTLSAEARVMSTTPAAACIASAVEGDSGIGRGSGRNDSPTSRRAADESTFASEWAAVPIRDHGGVGRARANCAKKGVALVGGPRYRPPVDSIAQCGRAKKALRKPEFLDCFITSRCLP